MTTKSDLFKAICSICLTCFILLVSAPLITLAIPTTQIVPVIQTTSPQQPIEKANISNDSADLNSSSPVDAKNKPEYDEFTYLERKERNLPTHLPVSDPFYGNKVVYLTFDDGPDAENTPTVLDILNKNQIKATFFVVGTAIEKNPDVLKRIYNEGHAIGNHSYNHIYRELYQSVTAYTEQLHHNEKIIKNVLNLRPYISRAPGGSSGHFTKTYWNTLNNQGYIEVGWNISSGDASNATAEQILNNIILQTEKNDFLWSHAIVLMHDAKGHEETVKALPHIIKFYKEHGFEFHVINSKTPPAW